MRKGDIRHTTANVPWRVVAHYRYGRLEAVEGAIISAKRPGTVDRHRELFAGILQEFDVAIEIQDVTAARSGLQNVNLPISVKSREGRSSGMRSGYRIA